MVRVFIRNGVCAVEQFFKLFGAEQRVEIFLACSRQETITFRELSVELSEMDKTALAKRLTEFVKGGVLEKLSYGGSKTVYHLTQKSVDVLPILEHMKTFCSAWIEPKPLDAFYWISSTKKLLGSRWSARIIWLLFVLRSVRFNDLKNSIEGISFKMLTQQLRYLENEDIVLRKDFQENPPHVEYALTKKGEELYEILLQIASWDSRYNRKRGETPGGLELSI